MKKSSSRGSFSRCAPSGAAHSDTTRDPRQKAVAGVSFDGTHVHFTLSIPRGEPGIPGATGQPGEVSQTDLHNAMTTTLAQTNANTNAVNTLDTP